MKIHITKSLSFPEHLDLEATNHCQLKCICCPRQFMKREQGFMSWKVLKKIVEESAGTVKTCYFHQMGEPLLHPHILPMIKYIKNSGIEVAISTNAMLLTPEMSTGLFEIGLDYLYLSLDSLKKNTYEGIRVGAKLKDIHANIIGCLETRRQKKEYKTHVNLQMIRMRDNVEEIGEFRKQFESRLEGIGHFSVKPYSMWAGHVKDYRLEPHISESFVCTMTNYSMSIYWNGDATICCMDYDGFTKVGNVLTQNLEEIWKSKKYQEYRDAHKIRDFNKLKFCSGCYLASEFKIRYIGEVYAALGRQDYIPWFNYETIELLKKIVTKDSEIMETGSGNSTIWFAKRVKRMVAYENLYRWYLGVQNEIEKEGLENVTHYYDPKYVDKPLRDEGPFDIIILDGDDYPNARVKAMKRFVPKYLKQGGYLIVDDIHRENYRPGVEYLDTLGLKKTLLSGSGPIAAMKPATTAVYQKI